MNRVAVRQALVRFLVAGLVLAGLCLFVWWMIPANKPPEEEKPQVAPVKAVPASLASFGEWTPLMGTSLPLPGQSGQVSAPAGGQIVEVLVDEAGKRIVEGGRVKARQVLVRLDDRVALANRAKVEANLAELEDQRKQAQLAVDLADIDVKRLEELSKSSGGGNPVPLVSRIELEKARIGLKDAESRRQAVTSRKVSLQAELKALDAQVDFTRLRAPLTGEIGLINAMPGQTIAAGATVAEVINLDDIDILCFVPPATVSHLSLDQPARLAEGQEPTGKVVFIAQQAQADTGNFAVKIRFPNKETRLRANLVVRPQILTQPSKERLSIPESALLEDQEPPVVIVVQDVKTETKDGKEERTGKAHKLQAVVGVRDRAQHLVEVLQLLDPEKKTPVPLRDLMVVTEGAHGLHDDDTLKLEAGDEK